MCHCFAEAVPGVTRRPGTACAKQWHTTMKSVCWNVTGRGRGRSTFQLGPERMLPVAAGADVFQQRAKVRLDESVGSCQAAGR